MNLTEISSQTKKLVAEKQQLEMKIACNPKNQEAIARLSAVKKRLLELVTVEPAPPPPPQP